MFSFTSRLTASTNSIIRAIENCWLIKYVTWKPWHIDKTGFIATWNVMFVLHCVVLYYMYIRVALLSQSRVFLNNILYNFIIIYGRFSLK